MGGLLETLEPTECAFRPYLSPGRNSGPARLPAPSGAPHSLPTIAANLVRVHRTQTECARHGLPGPPRAFSRGRRVAKPSYLPARLGACAGRAHLTLQVQSCDKTAVA